MFFAFIGEGNFVIPGFVPHDPAVEFTITINENDGILRGFAGNSGDFTGNAESFQFIIIRVEIINLLPGTFIVNHQIRLIDTGFSGIKTGILKEKFTITGSAAESVKGMFAAVVAFVITGDDQRGGKGFLGVTVFIRHPVIGIGCFQIENGFGINTVAALVGHADIVIDGLINPFVPFVDYGIEHIGVIRTGSDAVIGNNVKVSLNTGIGHGILAVDLHRPGTVFFVQLLGVKVIFDEVAVNHTAVDRSPFVPAVEEELTGQNGIVAEGGFTPIGGAFGHVHTAGIKNGAAGITPGIRRPDGQDDTDFTVGNENIGGMNRKAILEDRGRAIRFIPQICFGGTDIQIIGGKTIRDFFINREFCRIIGVILNIGIICCRNPCRETKH